MVKLNIIIEAKTCGDCPNNETSRTEGAGYALDYYCKLLMRQTSGYVEWPSDVKPIPDDCPVRMKETESKGYPEEWDDDMPW